MCRWGERRCSGAEATTTKPARERPSPFELLRGDVAHWLLPPPRTGQALGVDSLRPGLVVARGSLKENVNPNVGLCEQKTRL